MKYHRPEPFPPLIKNLIIINALVFVAQKIFDEQFALTLRLGLWPIDSSSFQPYQIATHMFTHADFRHIFFNMFGLWLFGARLESFWGPKRFLLFYFICGVTAAAAHLVMQYYMGGFSYAVGASGAVMGVLAAFGYLFPNTELSSFLIPIPIKAKWIVILMIIGDIMGGFGVVNNNGVAHFAHLGGALAGIILVLIWNKTNRRGFY